MWDGGGMDLSALQSQAGVWIGFYQGLFIAPEAWLAGASEAQVAQMLPTQWRSTSPEAIFVLGQQAGHNLFVVQLSLGETQTQPPVPSGFRAAPLRAFVGQVAEPVFSVLSRGAQILRWHSDYQFCPKCGVAFASADQLLEPMQEWVKQCVGCGQGQYPRISPCVLVLVVDEWSGPAPRLLLARGVRHPAGMWSTLAGFIEPGETAEAAVAREVAEEVGVTVTDLVYRRSQPWPFPHALMLGFWAKAQTIDLTLDATEIVAAQWISCAHLSDNGLPSGQFLPPVGTLSRQLIDDYLSANR